MTRSRSYSSRSPVLLYVVLALSLALNMYLVLDREGGQLQEPAVHQAVEAGAPLEHLAPVSVEPASLELMPQKAGVGTDKASSGAMSTWQHVDAEVKHSLARTFQNAVSDRGDALAAVYSRMFMWDLDLRRDVQRGDRVLAVYSDPESSEPAIPVAWYESHKLNRTLKAYQYHAPGDDWPSYWDEEGTEVPYRLVGGPLESYEQVTALLKDRPSHQGMDFKVPTGTSVLSPKAGSVTRVNWNTHSNGSCVEIRYPDGTLAKFLHLDSVRVRPRQHVTSGQVIATSGNSGRSTAPHLHYQLNRGSKTLDPVEYHGTSRRQLPEIAMADFQLQIRRSDALLLGEAVVQN